MKAYCPDCMGALAATSADSVRCTIHGGTYQVLFQREPLNPPVLEVSGGTPAGTPPKLAGHRCVQHPNLPATRQCQACGAYMCDTCDFALPGNIHVCPACATKPQTEMSSKRKGQRGWSYGLAIGATLGLGVIFSGTINADPNNPGSEDAVGTLFMFIVLIPALVGMALGMGAIDRRLTNPISLWIPTIWNGLIVGLFLLLCVIGLMG